MKNNISYILALSAGSVISAYYFPWWSVAIVSGLLSFLYEHYRLKAVILSFGTVSVLFTIIAMFMNFSSDSKIVEMISAVFKNVGVMNLYFITGLLFGITAALGSWTGSSLRYLLFR